jgi:pimeloyl-ACP methyl ester carboxylesterase
MSDESTYEPQVAVRTSSHRIRGVDYHVNEWGEADQPLIVYLHGWGDAGSTLQFVVDELNSGWHIVAPDWRGFGRTTCRAPSYWFPDYLADLDCLLAEYSPSAPVRLAGHSMGANVGGLYAGVMPERVSAFVNVEGFGLADSAPGDAPERYRTWLERGRVEPAFGSFENFDALARHIRKRSPHMTLAQARFVARAWATDGEDTLQLRADPAHKLPNAVLYRRAEAEACWRKVTAPVLLVAGAESNILEAFGDVLSETNQALPFPERRSLVIDDAGHMVHFEAPRALADAIEEFFQPTL